MWVGILPTHRDLYYGRPRASSACLLKNSRSLSFRTLFGLLALLRSFFTNSLYSASVISPSASYLAVAVGRLMYSSTVSSLAMGPSCLVALWEHQINNELYHIKKGIPYPMYITYYIHWLRDPERSKCS